MRESARKLPVIFVYVVLLCCVLLVYWQVHRFGFVNYDDNSYVYENPHVLSGLTRDGVLWAFTSVYSCNWHPLTWLSHMLDCQLFGRSPGAMHMVNLMFHLGSTLLLFTVLRRMTGTLWRSFFVAAAFALHPAHVESVAWIAERKDVLSTFFMMLTLLAYHGYVARSSRLRYILVLALFAMGLMAKPMLVTLPLLLLLLDYWPLNRFNRHAVWEKVPFLVLSILSSLVTFIAQHSSGAVVDTGTLPLLYRIYNAFLAYVRYIFIAVWPLDLGVFHPFDVARFPLWQIAVCALLLVTVSVVVVRLGRSHRYLPVGWFWFVIMLVPVIGIVQVGRQAHADRYTYVSYIGLFVIVAWGLHELLGRWRMRNFVLGAAMVIILPAMALCTSLQADYWVDSLTLFSHTIDVTRDNDVAHNNRAVAWNSLACWKEAIRDCNEAIRISPDYSDAYNNRGMALYGLRRWQEAAYSHERAVKLRPDFAEAHNNLGADYGELGRWQEAEQEFRRAIQLKPDYADAYGNLGNLYVIHGRNADAAREYRKSLACNPDRPSPLNNLAWILATDPCDSLRNATEAMRMAGRACELTGYQDPCSLDTLAAAYASAGRFTEAINIADRALKGASGPGSEAMKQAIEQHLSFYRQGKPYVELPAPAAAAK